MGSKITLNPNDFLLFFGHKNTETFFKISSSVFHRTKEVKLVWNYFWMNYPSTYRSNEWLFLSSSLFLICRALTLGFTVKSDIENVGIWTSEAFWSVGCSGCPLQRRIRKGNYLAQHTSDLCETLNERTFALVPDHYCCNAHSKSVDVSSRRSEGFGTDFFPTMVLCSVAQSVS